MFDKKYLDTARVKTWSQNYNVIAQQLSARFLCIITKTHTCTRVRQHVKLIDELYLYTVTLSHIKIWLSEASRSILYYYLLALGTAHLHEL